MSAAAARFLGPLLRTLLLALLAGAAWAQPGERILDYDIEVDVRADGSLLVAEHITVRAEQNRIRRGIYRDFPTRYRDRFGNNVVVDLDVLGVERDGAPEPWFTERLSNGVRINTGNDAFLPRFPAEYRYTLRYRTTRQLGFFADHDELYWNAIGTGWDFAIDKGRVEVRLPERIPIDEMQVEAYTGPQGAKGQAYRASRVAPGVARFELTEPLPPYNGLTIVVSFPKGVVAEPTAAQRAGWLLRDNAGLLTAFAGLVLLLAFCAARWQRVGRDPRRGTIIARYEPPEGRSPAELRYLLRRRYDPRCFTSDLLISAVNGRVAIERERRRLLGDRWFVRSTGDGSGAAAPHTVAALTAALFGKGDRVELDKKNASLLQRVRTLHAKALDSRLRGSHFNRNGGSVVVAALIAGLAGVLAFQLSGGGSLGVVVLCGLMAVTVFVFAWLVQAPTQGGRRLLDEAEGLKLYLSVAERDELAAMQNPADAPERPVLDASRYERLLPYAIALDVEDAWTKKFTAAVGAAAAAAATSQIAWYHGGRADDLGGIAKALGGGLTSSIASASTPPGSSSGGGGGGSSGGGGGGGGGGGR